MFKKRKSKTLIADDFAREIRKREVLKWLEKWINRFLSLVHWQYRVSLLELPPELKDNPNFLGRERF